MQGPQGSAGEPSAMQTIIVKCKTYSSGRLTSVVSPGANATLANGVLKLDNMRGEDGTHGLDGSDATVTASSGISVVNGVVSNTEPSPDFGVIAGGGLSNYLPAQVNAVRFNYCTCLLYTSPSPRDRQKSRMPSSA